MEEAEHALWRENGLSVFPAAPTHGWPRVAASFDYKRPLRFEDEFEVHLRVDQVTTRSLRYACRVECRGEVVAEGGMTIVCVERAADHTMRAVPIPEPIASLFRRCPSHERRSVDSGSGRARRPAGGAPRGAGRAHRRRNAFYTRKLAAAGVDAGGGGARRRDRPALHDQGGADRRPGRARALGQRAHRADRRLHALSPDILDDRASAALARHQRQLAVGARLLEIGVRGGPRPARRSGAVRVLVRAVPRLLDGVRGGLPDRRALRAGRRHDQPPAPRPDRRRAAGRPLVHADLRAAARRGRRGRARPRPARGERRADDHRRRGDGRQRVGGPRPHRARLGRPRHRSLRPHRGRPGRVRGLGSARAAST